MGYRLSDCTLPTAENWDPWSFDYDEMTDEQREELDRFGARCREGLERARNRPEREWPEDDCFDSSDTDDGSRTPTGLLTPDPEARVAKRPAREKYQPRCELPSAAEWATSTEALLDVAASGPAEGRPVVDFHNNTKRHGYSPGLWHDLWGTRHNTRFEKRRRSYLFALNDAGQPAVVTVGENESPCGFSTSTAVSPGLTQLCAIARLYDPFSIAGDKWEELRAAGFPTYSERSHVDFMRDYLQGPEVKRITRGAKHINQEIEAYLRAFPRQRDAQTSRKGKGYNTQRIEKRGRRPRGSRKMPRGQKTQRATDINSR